MSEILAIYPDRLIDHQRPPRLDREGRQLFDKLIVAVLTNLEKEPLFTVAERVEMLREATKSIPNVSSIPSADCSWITLGRGRRRRSCAVFELSPITSMSCKWR